MLEVEVKARLGEFLLEAAFALPVKGIIALFGPSGSGKTSLVNAMAGLFKPDQGRIVVNGRVLFDSGEGINLPPEKRGLGYVFQEGRLFPHLSVRANLLYGYNLAPQRRRHLQLERIVALLGIGRLLERRPAKLSGGEKQRVAVGRALLSNPDLLLMDEPLASLDQERKKELLGFLARLPGELGTPIVYVTHDPAEIEALDAKVVGLRGGRVAPNQA